MPAEDQTPQLIYAVGDIHGHAKKLRALWASIEADARVRIAPGEQALVVFLGDYIDRGPDSKGVLDFLFELQSVPPAWAQIEFLAGNHEAILLHFIDTEDAETFVGWRLPQIGGAACLKSYGVAAESPSATAAKLHAALGPRHLDFLRGAHALLAVPGFVFVHAGIRPGVPLGEQTAEDCAWIRHEFIEHPGPHGDFRVVHGHTPCGATPRILPHRICVDTGAARGGPVSAVRIFRGHEFGVLQAR